MNITVIHGQVHKGNTYNITHELINNLNNSNKIDFNKEDLNEYFLYKDAPYFCVGCNKCFYDSEFSCPSSEYIQKIVDSIIKSDLLIIDSPTYVLEMTGALKNFFDHLAYMWVSHRPREEMFSKKAIIISSAAGHGTKNVIKSIKKQLFYLGITDVYSYGKNVASAKWDDTSDKIKEKIKEDILKLSKKINNKKAKTSLKMKIVFYFMTKMQKSNNYNPKDRDYWEEKGWLDDNKPWK